MFVMPNTAKRKTVSILARKQQHLNHVSGVSTTKGGINLYIEFDQIAARNTKMSLDKRVAISE